MKKQMIILFGLVGLVILIYVKEKNAVDDLLLIPSLQNNQDEPQQQLIINDTGDHHQHHIGHNNADMQMQLDFEEQVKSVDDIIPAVRSSIIEYNSISNKSQDKYLLFSPSGGWSNQLACLESAIQIGHILNRIVLVPQAGRHSNGWGNYNKLKSNVDLFPMDKLLDFKYMEGYGTRVVPLNITVDEMRLKILHTYNHNQFKVIRDDDKLKLMGITDVREWRSINARFVYITGKGMYHRWFSTPIYSEIRKYIRPALFIRQYALLIAESLGGVGNFNAVHIRKGDYFRADKTPEAEDWAKKLHAAKMKRNTVLYIATEPTGDHDPWFRPITKDFKDVKFSKDLPDTLIHSYKRIFPQKTRSDFLGLLEQMICVEADKFLPSNYSTFSAWINFIRKHKEMLFPEIFNYKNKKDEIIFSINKTTQTTTTTSTINSSP